MCKDTKNTEVEKVYLRPGGVVIVEWDKKQPRPLIKAFMGG